jgi:hypothetical protein
VCWHISTGQPQRTASAGTHDHAPVGDLHTEMATSFSPPAAINQPHHTAGYCKKIGIPGELQAWPYRCAEAAEPSRLLLLLMLGEIEGVWRTCAAFQDLLQSFQRSRTLKLDLGFRVRVYCLLEQKFAAHLFALKWPPPLYLVFERYYIFAKPRCQPCHSQLDAGQPGTLVSARQR